MAASSRYVSLAGLDVATRAIQRAIVTCGHGHRPASVERQMLMWLALLPPPRLLFPIQPAAPSADSTYAVASNLALLSLPTFSAESSGVLPLLS